MTQRPRKINTFLIAYGTSSSNAINQKNNLVTRGDQILQTDINPTIPFQSFALLGLMCNQ